MKGQSVAIVQASEDCETIEHIAKEKMGSLAWVVRAAAEGSSVNKWPFWKGQR